MKQTKYVHSGGLAFAEEKDMKKLSEYAREGWLVERFAGPGYKLRKGERMNVEYSLDYQKDADDEYFMIFAEAGWTHVCSVGKEIHLFRAPIGTKPIYTDKLTTIEKYERELKQMGKAALPFLIATVFCLLLVMLSKIGLIPIMLGNVMGILAAVSLIILVFPGLPYISYLFKVYKLKRQS